ncbi:MAG: MBL fold metallo-hydrolase [Victivallales bacterium]|nr:MBL fold metallo-hydrolase [Victivallales bacterium]
MKVLRGILFMVLAAFSLLAVEGVVEFPFGKHVLYAIQDAPSRMSRDLFRVEGGKFKYNKPFADSSCNVFLVKTKNGRYVLFDTGNGGKRGTLLKKLEEMEVPLFQIQEIFITHIHPDHVGGLLDERGIPLFPKALIYINQKEIDACTASINKMNKTWTLISQAYGRRIMPFNYTDRVGRDNVIANVGAGHTPGHTVFQWGNLLLAGDFLHAAAVQLAKPEICTDYDWKFGAAVKTRRQVLQQAVDENLVIAGCHLPMPGVITVTSNGKDGYVGKYYEAESKILSPNPDEEN